MFLSLVEGAFIVVPILVNVAFFTLLERKVLGLSQSRKGPNKVSVVGIMQPISDAVKLFVKENKAPLSGGSAFFFAPATALVIMLASWQLIPGGGGADRGEHSLILLIVFLSVGLYPLLIAGWSSNSKYALVGALRGVAQTISYEISMALIALSFSFLVASLHLSAWKDSGVGLIWGPCIPLLFFWVVSCVAETNRTPFDFAEGESELVSGFNIEYGAGSFALIFMAEYGSIMFLSALSSVAFLGSSFSSPALWTMTLMLAIFWVWARATLPRFRYDKLMSMAWKSILPASLGGVALSSGLAS